MEDQPSASTATLDPALLPDNASSETMEEIASEALPISTVAEAKPMMETEEIGTTMDEDPLRSATPLEEAMPAVDMDSETALIDVVSAAVVSVKAEEVEEVEEAVSSEDSLQPTASVDVALSAPGSNDALLEEISSFITASAQSAVRPPAPSTSSAGPTSKLAQLIARIEKDPCDGEARLALLADTEAKGDLERTREVYEEFLKIFPDASKQWIAYADLELSHGLFTRVEEIFARCLRPSPSVDLWKFYLDYIRRVNPIEGERAKDARALIGKSFEFALQYVGHDRKAGEMWTEYIGFLKQGGDTQGTWEDQQRLDSLRKAYQRAVCIPLNNVEQIWQDYNLFENALNKMTAKKFVAELSPSYMTARKALRELRAMYDNLYEPSLPSRPDWSNQTRQRLEVWKRYLAYEEANPLDIEDPVILQARVQFAFKRAVGSLRFFSEIWSLAANFYNRIDKPDEAATLLRSGMEANSSSLLLAYTLAEYEESKGEISTCYSIYDALIVHFHSEIHALNTATELEIAEALAHFDSDSSTVSDLGNDHETNGEDVESRQKRMLEKEEISSAIRTKRSNDVEVAKNAAANVWITELRFARRAEDLKAARSVFAKARKSPYPTWRVIEAAATLELYWNKDIKVAMNVFEFGLKAFGDNAEYVIQYLDFLIKSNNDSNARALFERSVVKIEPAQAKPIWDRWALYEYQYGDFAAAKRLSERYSEAFPEVSPIDRFMNRHGYAGLSEAIAKDLGVFPSVSEEVQTSLQLQQNEQRSSRSPSPSRVNKRRPSPETGTMDRADRAQSSERNAYPSRGGDSFATGSDAGIKRLKQYHRESSSPGPHDSNRSAPPPSGPSGWGRVPKEEQRDDMDGRSRRREPPPRNDLQPAQVLHQLDAAGRVTGPLPDGVLFFLSILPNAASFNGPILDPLTVVEVIATTILPGSAPGGFAAERLGIPPRRRPAPSNYGHGDSMDRDSSKRGGDRDRQRSGSPAAAPYRGGGAGGGGDRDYGYGGGYGGGGGAGGGGRY